MEIKTQLALQFLSLEKKSFLIIDEYMTALRTIMKQKGICVNDLLQYSKSKIENKKELSLIYKDESLKQIYNKFIDKYFNIIKELFNKGFFWDIYYASNDYYIDNALNIITYIKNNYENKEVIRNNIKKIIEYHISNIIFDEVNKIYDISIINNNGNMIVNGIYTDGQETFLSKKNNYFYPVLVKDANYVFEYEKNNTTDIKFYCKNLLFDNKSFPDIDFFEDKNILPKIDKEKIEELTEICKSIISLQNKIDDLTKTYYDPFIIKKEFLKESAEEYNFYNEILKSIIEKCEKIKQNMIEKCAENGYTKEEILESISKINKN